MKRSPRIGRGGAFALLLALLTGLTCQAQPGKSQSAAPQQETMHELGSSRVGLTFLFFGLRDDTLVVRKRYEVNRADPNEAAPVRIYLPPQRTGDTKVTLSGGETSETVIPHAAGEGPGDWVTIPAGTGQTTLDVEYSMPHVAEGQTYEEKFFYPVEVFQVFAYPSTLRVESTQLEPIGADPETGAVRYHTSGAFQPGQSLQLTLQSAPLAPPAGHPPAHERRIVEMPPRIAHFQVPIIAGMTLALLLLAWAGSLRIARGRSAGCNTR